MIDVNELRSGVTFELDDNLFKVIEYSHHKIGRGKASIRTKIRNMRNGVITDKTFTSGDKVQDVHLDYREVQYLYNDGDLYYFMDTETYEQPILNASMLGDAIQYLKEGLVVKLTSYENDPLDIDLPTAVELTVVEAQAGVKGDTATGANKLVTVETGLKVQVPLFINQGDTIRVDSRNGAYLTRV
ncbi:MAG: elongation factor P [Chloroflexi bacterium]|nr:elongation factor P [Chloroflexota bacterium]